MGEVKWHERRIWRAAQVSRAWPKAASLAKQYIASRCCHSCEPRLPLDGARARAPSPAVKATSLAKFNYPFHLLLSSCTDSEQPRVDSLYKRLQGTGEDHIFVRCP